MNRIQPPERCLPTRRHTMHARTRSRHRLTLEVLEPRRLLTLFDPLISHFSGGVNPYNMDTADFDGDGDLDIAVANIARRLGILLNDGHGAFTTTSFTTPLRNYNVAAGDFDADGDPDVAITTFEDVQIMANDGSGVFLLHDRIPTGSLRGYNLDTGDFNEDGFLDLAVGGNGLAVFWGDGQLAFSPPVLIRPHAFIHDTLVGDLNHDGHADVIGANRDGSSASVILGNGDGTFQPAVDYPLGGKNETRHLALGDLNHDGSLDIVSANRSTHAVGVILGDGRGGFGLPSEFSLLGGPLDGSLPYSIQIADFNGDGHPDVVTAHRNTTGTVSILLGDGTGNLTLAEVIKASGEYTKDVVVGDFNGDRLPDIAEQSIRGPSVGILLNRGPIARTDGPYTILEGEGLRLDGSMSLRGADAIYDWDLDGNGSFDVCGQIVELSAAQLAALGIGTGSYSGDVTLRVTAGLAQSWTTTSLTVTPVNDAPSFLAGSDQVVDEDAGRQAIAGWATAITPGPADEADQRVWFRVITNNPGLFRTQPTVAPDGTLTYTPAVDAFGTATVTIILHDDGGTAHGGIDRSDPQMFLIRVNPVVDAVIDVKPGSDPNSINLRSRGLLPVAVLTTQTAHGDSEDFDAKTVKTNTIKLNGIKVDPVHAVFRDVDGDGDEDLLLHVRIPELVAAGALDEESVDLALIAEFVGGQALGADLGGSDSVRIVPPDRKGELNR